ncbi:MAG: hypothetical protein AXA67_12625 [Methylothermaceae bacteria B42]|nr:MAG: hypothetical protein AXA67_12625 [Methylothermaceae bacteria B42]HHJ37996.1 pilus assembly protein PilW [Methylothermaceae bacterium]
MKRQRGISLVEIMVSLVAGLILTAGVIQIFVANKQTYRVAEASSRLQENARFMMELLSRDLRMAGYLGCATRDRTIVNTLNDTTSFLYDFNTAVEGLEATSSSAWDTTPDNSITSPLPGRDILTIRGVFGNETPITGQPSNTGDCTNAASHTANLKVANTSGLSAGDIVIAGNCSRASIFQITNVNTSSATVVHNTGGSNPGNSTKDLGACYAGNGSLTKISTRTFYIRNNPAGNPALYRKNDSSPAEELIEGVENMQVLYGIDTDNDDSANQFVPANNVSDWSQVTSVRVSLLLQSTEDNITNAPQSYTFNGATITPSDRRLRKVYTATFGIRNRLP